MRLAHLAGIEPSSAVRESYQHLDAEAPDDYRQLAVLLVDDWQRRGVSTVGIGGGQGAGKSTLSRLIGAAGAMLGVSIAVLGIDEFYLTKAERQRLGEQVHPLLATRGPPGTHATALASDALAALRRPGAVTVPRFDKGQDDRAGMVTLHGPVDVVVLEGWCVGASPAGSATALAKPINALERDDDGDGRWRRYVDAALRNEYASLFRQLDALVFLQVPDLDAVRRWRLEQERERPPELRMTAEAVRHFVAHYERVTTRMLAELPTTADVVVQLDHEHRVAGLRFRHP